MRTAWIGDIALELPEWPTALSRRSSHNYAEHQPVSRAPLLQSTGRNLVEYSFEGRLHRQFGRAPSELLTTLRAMVDDAQAMALVFGSGEYPGKFVVTELSEQSEATGSDGSPDSVLVQLTLREYVENDRLSSPIRSQLENAKGLVRQMVEGVRRWLQ